jgi:hypothetical protein
VSGAAVKQGPRRELPALGGVYSGADTVHDMHVMSGKAQLAYEFVNDPEDVDVFLIHAGVTDRRS